MSNRSSILPSLLIVSAAFALSPALGSGGGGGGGGGSERVSNEIRDSQRTREREARESARAAERETREAQKQADGATRDVRELQERTAKEAEDAAEREARALEEGGSTSGSSGSGDSGLSESGTSGSGTSGSNSGSDSSGSGSSGSGSSGSGDSGSDNSGSGSSGSGSSNSGSGESDDIGSFRDLAAGEHPDFDGQGFPARRGEVVSLDLDASQIRAAEAQGFRLVERVRLKALGIDMVRLRVPDGVPLDQALSRLRTSGNGTSDFDHYFAANGDTTSPAQPGAATATTASRSLLIGMIDTAIAPNRAFAGLRIEPHNFSEGAPPVAHGTAVASVLRRLGAARIFSANVFTNDARPYAPADRIVRAIDWLMGQHVPVINISIAGPRNAVLDRAMANATSKGFVVVAAAGNAGPTAPAAFPAASPGVVAVTAVDRAGRVYLRANRGTYIAMSAMGVGVAAATPTGEMKLHSGTSFAAPFVTAHLARCMEHRGRKAAAACIAQMQARARDLGAPGRDPVYGYGLLMP